MTNLKSPVVTMRSPRSSANPFSHRAIDSRVPGDAGSASATGQLVLRTTGRCRLRGHFRSSTTAIAGKIDKRPRRAASDFYVSGRPQPQVHASPGKPGWWRRSCLMSLLRSQITKGGRRLRREPPGGALPVETSEDPAVGFADGEYRLSGRVLRPSSAPPVSGTLAFPLRLLRTRGPVVPEQRGLDGGER